MNAKFGSINANLHWSLIGVMLKNIWTLKYKLQKNITDEVVVNAVKKYEKKMLEHEIAVHVKKTRFFPRKKFNKHKVL